MRRQCCCSTAASTCSKRHRASPLRCCRVSRCPRARDEPRGAAPRRRGASSTSNRCRCRIPAPPTAPTRPRCSCLLARARRRVRDSTSTPDAARLAAEITRRVDGLPLAIELVAARVNVLGLAELLSIVERRLPLLDERSAPIRAAHPPGARRVELRPAAVGREDAAPPCLPCTEEALRWPSLLASLQSHGLDEATVTYLLGALVDKSIVSVSFPDGEARYDLLDTVRDYALERLDEGGGLPAAARGARGVLRDVWPTRRGRGCARWSGRRG